MKQNVHLPLILVSFLLCTRAVPAQTPVPPLPPRHAGPLYRVPGQIYPFDPATGQPVLPPALQAQIDERHHGDALASKGTIESAAGNWQQAVADYQQAVNLDPDETPALYGLGNYSLTKGYTQAALGYYRQAIYAHPDPPALPQFREWNAFRMMEYALLLSHTGQQDEALTVYRHAAQILNHRLPMPLPDFGGGAGQFPFTPERLQALAQVGWAYDHSDFDQAGAAARLRQAVALFPDSPVPDFYRARDEARYGTDYKAAGAAFDRAAQLSDGADEDAVQHERHLFQYWIDTATQPAQAPKAAP